MFTEPKRCLYYCFCNLPKGVLAHHYKIQTEQFLAFSSFLYFIDSSTPQKQKHYKLPCAIPRIMSNKSIGLR